MGEKLKRYRTVLALIAAATGLVACGDDEQFANKPRPPAPISISAVIAEDGIAVDPPSFGAGVVNITISNQTDKTRSLTVETSGSGAGTKQSTSPINPQGSGDLTVDLTEGKYTVSVDGPQVKDATLDVGPERASSQDKLLLP